MKDKEGNINCWAQKEKKKEGPDSTWKVYSRNRWCKKEIGSNGTAGLKSEQKRQPNNNERQQLNSGPNSHEASPTMLKGSGVKVKGRRKENKKREFSGKRERLFFFKKMIKP